MPLYELGTDGISVVPTTSFAALGLRERDDLQRLLRENIAVIGPNTLVITDEFGDWEDSKRRIDLLCLDNEANLVVVELKRSEDGGHMELQALRYAAMVSTMTFEQAVEAHSAFLARSGRNDDSMTEILDFLGWVEPNDDDFGRRVRLILASADFSKEVTTTVLWLNRLGLDISCVRLVPYKHGTSTLLDVQPLIPLREAAEYQVRLKHKEQQQQIAKESARQKDYTKFVVTTADGPTEPLAKPWAVLKVVQALVHRGVPISDIEQLMKTQHRFGPGVLRSAPRRLGRKEFVDALGLKGREVRYFCGESELLHDQERTYALTNQWGAGTAEALDALLAAFPGSGVSCVAFTQAP